MSGLLIFWFLYLEHSIPQIFRSLSILRSLLKCHPIREVFSYPSTIKASPRNHFLSPYPSLYCIYFVYSLSLFIYLFLAPQPPSSLGRGGLFALQASSPPVLGRQLGSWPLTSRELYMGDLMGVATGQLIRFSFWRRLQNQTLTTSFSMDNCSAIMEISSELGLGFYRNQRDRVVRRRRE